MAIFLDQNGVLSMGDKTPVTILQETLQKRGLTPHYELLYNGAGQIEPLFKFQVTAANLSAIGDGRTKKAAKHDAAAALLKRMQVNKALTESADIIGTEDVDIASPYTGSINQNFVGMLDEVCVINRLPYAIITPVREEGPPHARVFTMQCKVSTITETAVARTKKQAKHLASQQMIRRIEEILGDKYTPPAEKTVGNDIDDVDDLYSVSNLLALECGDVKLDLTNPISNMHNTFFFRPEEYLLPKSFEDLSVKNEKFYENMENPKAFLDDLLQELGGMCKLFHLSKCDLKKAMEEIDKELESRYCLYEEGNLSEAENTHQTDINEDKSHVDQNVLPDFDLEDSEENSSSLPVAEILTRSESREVLPDFDLEDCEENSSSLPVAEILTRSESREEQTDISIENQHPLFSEIQNKPCLVFLSVQCLQGVWAFRGFGDNSDDAINAAAVKALKFFRLLSIRSKNIKLVFTPIVHY